MDDLHGETITLALRLTSIHIFICKDPGKLTCSCQTKSAMLAMHGWPKAVPIRLYPDSQQQLQLQQLYRSLW